MVKTLQTPNKANFHLLTTKQLPIFQHSILSNNPNKYMGNCSTNKESHSIQQMAYLRALYSQKLSLKYDIELQKMKENFDNIHLSMMQGDESLHFYTVVAKKIAEIHSLVGHVRKYGRKGQETSKFMQLLQHETEKKKNFSNINFAKPEDLIASDVKKVSQMEKKYQKLIKRLACLKEVFEENNEKIDEKIRQSSDLIEVCSEIQDLRYYKSFLDSVKSFFRDKKLLDLNSKNSCSKIGVEEIPQTLFVLKQSRILVNEYRTKLEMLRERVDSKILSCVNKHEDFYSNMMVFKIDNSITN
jgi:hypothetical protein